MAFFFCPFRCTCPSTETQLLIRKLPLLKLFWCFVQSIISRFCWPNSLTLVVFSLVLLIHIFIKFNNRKKLHFIYGIRDQKATSKKKIKTKVFHHLLHKLFSINSCIFFRFVGIRTKALSYEKKLKLYTAEVADWYQLIKITSKFNIGIFYRPSL